jgi:predicted metal-binding protein
MKESDWADPNRLNQIEQLALRLGASATRFISTSDILVEDVLAKLCQESRCENFGLAASCPPHVTGPSGFRKLLKNYDRAMVFKLDVPSDILLSSERGDVFRLLHEIAAGLEQELVQMGYQHAKAYAGGSCKQLFCQDHSDCSVIKDGDRCRNPDNARPSMSGYGINVERLMQVAGWSMSWVNRGKHTELASMATLCGLVLIG